MTTHKREDLEALAGHYDTTDTSAELGRASFEDRAAAEPMVTTSLRLPKPLMDELRAEADAAGIRVTALMRQWLEERLAARDAPNVTVSLAEVQKALAGLARRSRTSAS